jgi:hypothetical protein
MEEERAYKNTQKDITQLAPYFTILYFWKYLKN